MPIEKKEEKEFKKRKEMQVEKCLFLYEIKKRQNEKEGEKKIETLICIGFK